MIPYTRLAILAITIALPWDALADTLPPAMQACQGLDAGAPCGLFESDLGICVEQTCVGKYGDPDYPCLICKEVEGPTGAEPTAAPEHHSRCNAGLPVPLLALGFAVLLAARRQRR